MNQVLPPPYSQQRANSGRWLALAIILVLLQAIPNISYPLGRDQATYCLIGRGLTHGQALYRDLWDNKPPGIFYIYALIVKIFGPAMWSAGLVDILWLLAISILLFSFTERMLGKTGAALAVVVNSAMHVRAGYWDAGQPETFLMLFVFAGYLLLAGNGRKQWLRSACAGALFAAAFWVKYNAIAFLPILFMAFFFAVENLESHPVRMKLEIRWRERHLAAISFAAGFLVLSAVLLILIWHGGSWNAFLEEHFEVLPRYSAFAFPETRHYWLWAAGRVKEWLGVWTECAALAALTIAWNRNHLRQLAPAFIGAACGVAALALQIRYQPYYFETCYPFFAIFWAYLALQACQSTRHLAQRFARRNWQVARILVWGVLGSLIALCLPGPVVRMIVNYKALAAWHHNPSSFYADYTWPGAAEHFRDALHVVNYLKRNSSSVDEIYVWGNEPLIYYLSGHQPPTRFVWNLALIAPWRLSGWRQELVQDLDRSRPDFIIVARDDEVHDLSGIYQDSEEALQSFSALRIYVGSHYRPCQNYPTFEIYCRKGTVK